jgi:Tfp pilus assembly protein PilF
LAKLFSAPARPNEEALAHYERGLAQQDAGELAGAVESYRRAIALDPGLAKAHNNLGTLLQAQGDLQAAIGSYETALALDPRLLDAARNLGIAWLDRGDMRLAERYCRVALELSPASPELRTQFAHIHFNLGVAFEKERRFEDALHRYRAALELKNDCADAWLNAGALLELRGDAAGADEHYRRAIAARPDLVLAHFNRGLQLLLAGDYENGWKEYEWRWQLPEFATQRLQGPHWDGSPLAGRTILLYAEQGFGDAIQFVRYAPLVAQSGGRVLVRCPLQLASLFACVPAVDATVGDDAPLPAFDLCCPLLSVPHLLGTTLGTVPVAAPYFHLPEQKLAAWRAKLALAPNALKVGLVWASYSRSPVLTRRKSISLDLFAPLADVRSAAFYSLQKGPPAAEAGHPPSGLRIADLSGELRDFSDTAAAIANLDLVISVDSAVAHLAGAMARPGWTLAAFPPDWRWSREGDGCAWYPTMRIFRQTRAGEWTDVVARVAGALAERCG